MDNLNALPVEIALDIFTRLPIELVPNCKLVSKTWKDLIQHPSFPQLHLNRLINHYAESGKLSFLAMANNKKFYYLEYNDNHETPIKITRIKFTSPLKFNNHAFLGSFNGLICLRDSSSNFCICNPMTKEYVIVPEPRRVPGHNWLTGFGYLPSTNQYKVVSMYRGYSDQSVHIKLYTLGRGNGWRTVAKFYSELNNFTSEQGVFHNGALYWEKDGSGTIAVFDLGNESFQEQLPLPGSKDDTIGKEQQFQSLGSTKEFRRLRNEGLLGFTKSGDILSYSSKYLNIYDPITSTSKNLLDFSPDQKICKVFPHKNTLVSLKELGEKYTEIMELDEVEDLESNE